MRQAGKFLCHLFHPYCILGKEQVEHQSLCSINPRADRACPDFRKVARVLPTFAQQKLWPDSIDMLEIGPGRELCKGETGPKYERIATDWFRAEPLPLGGVFHLARAQSPSDPLVTPLDTQAAFGRSWAGIYRLPGAQALGLAPQLFDL